MPRRNSNARRNYAQERLERRAAKAERGKKFPALETPKIKIEPIRPLNAKQERYLDLLPTAETIIAIGPAGTGKTFVPTALAADMLRANEIDKLILTRPAVGVSEDPGALPGGIDAKYGAWVIPFIDVLEKRLGKQMVESLKLKGKIEIAPLAYMRGRTLENCMVILDEAQNTTIDQIKMFLTRIGENCTMVVAGDISQSDLTQRSGLAIIINMVKEQSLPVPIIEFTNEDIVRSAACAMWAEAFAKVTKHD